MEILYILIAALVMIPLSGYAVGRTLVREDIFSQLRDRVLYGQYQTVDDENGIKHYVYPNTPESLEAGETPRQGNSWFYASQSDSQPYGINVEYEEGIVEEVICIRRPNAYQGGFLGRLKGIIGDLIAECDLCSSAQASLWLSITYIVVSLLTSAFVATIVLLPTTAIGSTYILHGIAAKIQREPKQAIVVN